MGDGTRQSASAGKGPGVPGREQIQDARPYGGSGRRRDARTAIAASGLLSGLLRRSQQGKPMTTVEAWQAFAQLVPQQARIWLERLQAVNRATAEAVVGQVPPSRMSSISRQFTLEMLIENQKRLVTGERE